MVYNGLQQWVYDGRTVRFVYRMFEYSFVLGIFDLLGFRIFILALVRSHGVQISEGPPYTSGCHIPLLQRHLLKAAHELI